MRRLAIPVLSLSLSLLVGCASQETPGPSPATPRTAAPSSAPEPSPHAPSPGKKAYTFRLPIAAYSYRDADYEAIRSAERVLAGDCMREYGLSYRPAKAPAAATAPDRRYGLSDRSSAAHHGYRLPPQPAEPKEKLTKDQMKVLYGKRTLGDRAGDDAKLEYQGKAIPAEGCLGAAILGFRKPYEYRDGSAVASRIATASYAKSRTDPRVLAVFKEWSSCMKRKGYDYASPMDAMGAPEFGQGKVSARERETAVADVSCKEDTGLLDTWFDVEATLQRDMIEKDRKPLQKLAEMHRKKVSAARRIIVGG